MYLSMRGILIRHIAVACINGIITLIILLIAPLGLTAVITNTIMVVLSTLVTSAFVDGVVRFLNPGETEMLRNAQAQKAASVIPNRNYDELDRRP
ncbi:CRISPR-associated protein Csx18 [Laspinema olomoucense]|uniref:CRISPR-associated protein Csx18 n=1 Tax=Laspinema olomoucense D3b TaxID=2953688 RepID=A0ABT2NDA1_9CYAN|nr:MULTISPECIES: CRISPR-associated protein Csx18 [unclassified Laspinema]MCT7980431.1 CRISPR-associated protein Csx18 [Laspinema sp. D3b]MCT7996238.1 CRISPR-associated protein Csx18 [Laspinema sp. D3c]